MSSTSSSSWSSSSRSPSDKSSFCKMCCGLVLATSATALMATFVYGCKIATTSDRSLSSRPDGFRRRRCVSLISWVFGGLGWSSMAALVDGGKPPQANCSPSPLSPPSLRPVRGEHPRSSARSIPALQRTRAGTTTKTNVGVSHEELPWTEVWASPYRNVEAAVICIGWCSQVEEQNQWHSRGAEADSVARRLTGTTNGFLPAVRCCNDTSAMNSIHVRDVDAALL